jgi:transketolase C-terminal domain/subunit
MVIAAAMALSGMRVYYYTMINFSVFRPFEMVRNMVALHNAPVTILGVKGSSSYKFLGFSHNMVWESEDTYHLEKYMDCYIPQTNADVWRVLGESYEKNKPCYVRL